MLVARRPLKRFEIESGIVLDDRVSQITAATRPRGDVLSSCYPILDVEDGPCGYVSFCHFTALESVFLLLLPSCIDLLNIANRYLRTLYSSPVLQYPPAQLTVSLACVLYLISSIDLVDPRLHNEETRLQVVRCFHDLQLYVNDHWLDHLSALANPQTESLPDGYSMRSLSRGLERLTERHNEIASIKAYSAQDDGESLPSAMEEIWPQLGLSAAAQSLLNRALRYRSNSAKGDQLAERSCMYAAVLVSSIFVLC